MRIIQATHRKLNCTNLKPNQVADILSLGRSINIKLRVKHIFFHINQISIERHEKKKSSKLYILCH